MKKNNAVVNPAKGKKSPNLGPVAVMVSNAGDLGLICKQMDFDNGNYKAMYNSKLYSSGQVSDPCVVGPMVGAPYAVLVLENLIACGAKKILFIGWCGAVSHDVKIGDIIIPSGSIIDEGTSRHYNNCGQDAQAGEYNLCLASAPGNITKKTRETLIKHNLEFHEGIVWSIDAPFRETPEKIRYFQKKDALAVEMEISALFTVGKFRQVEVGGILVVSDELSTCSWVPGFKEKCFRESRKTAYKVIKSLCNIL